MRQIVQKCPNLVRFDIDMLDVGDSILNEIAKTCL